MTAPLVVSENVRRKAQALGASGLAWIDSLPGLIAELERDWAVEVGESLPGGSASYVAGVRLADGTDAVLKLAMPDGLEGQVDFVHQLTAIQAGQGHGYVDVLRVDEARRAMLQERLGSALGDAGLEIEAQLDVVAAVLPGTWRPPADPSPWRTGAGQASYLADFIGETWASVGEPCSAAVIEEARRCALARRDAFDPATAVLIHADAHAWNVLQDRSGGFKLIDPEGMRSEPAHDLGIPLRHWNTELLVGDPRERVRGWCAQLEDRTGVPAPAIWEWAMAERVSTGLFLLHLGDARGHEFLSVAETLVG